MLLLIFCFLPSIEDTVAPSEWHYLGPFSVGAREGIIGIADSPELINPSEIDTHPSMFIPGGRTNWKETQPDSSGWITSTYNSVRWDSLLTIWGYPGIINGKYFYSEFESKLRRRGLVLARKVSYFWLNGRKYHGSSYGKKWALFPVILKKGRNKILIEDTGFGESKFSFKILPAENPVKLIKGDITAPDLPRGRTTSLPAGIPVMNTTGRKINGISITIGDNSYIGKRTKKLSLYPRETRKVPLTIKLINEVEDSIYKLPVEISTESDTVKDTLPLKIYGEGEGYSRTFTSEIDSSVQYYGILPPDKIGGEEKHPLILSLHGASVEASGQINAYTKKDRAFVVAPTNRRPFGFDWEDWGAENVFNTLNEVNKNFNLDTNHIYLTGHSMGGHGTWVVGTNYPDRFAAMAPSAGWIDFERYIPWFLQKSEIYGPPGILSIRDRALIQDNPLALIRNLRNLPTYILHGGIDRNVPTPHGRFFYRKLKELNYRVKYREVPGKSHWWDHDYTHGTDCVDLDEMINFLLEKNRDNYPDTVIYSFSDPNKNDRAYWIKNLRQVKPISHSSIRGYIENNRIKIVTKNIRAFEIRLPTEIISEKRIEIDGQRPGNGRNVKPKFELRESKWFRVKEIPSIKSFLIKHAYYQPFLLVYGTNKFSDLLYDKALLQSYRWWQRANGYTRIMPDTLITPELAGNYNLILFGGPSSNRITREVMKETYIRDKNEKVYLNGEEVGERLSYIFIDRSPYSSSKFVLVYGGTDREMEELSDFFTPLYSGSGLPSYLIFDERVRSEGWAGVREAGFTGKN